MHVIVILTIYRYSVCMVDACYSYSHHLVFAPNHIILPSGSKKALPVIATRSYVTTSVTCTACIHVYVCSTYEVYNYRWLELKRAVRLVALLAALLLHVVLASRLVCEA